MLNTGHLQKWKYLCQNMGVKEGGGCLLEGGVVSGTYRTLFRASWFMLKIDEFRYPEAKTEKSEKASSHRESNLGYLWLETPVLWHWAMTTEQPSTILSSIWLPVTASIFTFLSKFFTSSVKHDALSISSEKRTQHQFFPDGEHYPVNP